MPQEITTLTPEEEARFQQWVRTNQIRDLDHPDSHYDYRGFWKANPTFTRAPGEHLTDQYKQHGHPTFSVESQYSAGPFDGGYWDQQDRYVAQKRSQSDDLVYDALQAQLP